MRMQMRRFTRLTNAFSKKLENLQAAVTLYLLGTISAASIRRCALLPQWKRALQIMCGSLRNYSIKSQEFTPKRSFGRTGVNFYERPYYST